MKKNSIIAVVVVLSATLFSCTKKTVYLNSSPRVTAPAALPQVKIVSDWLSLSLSNSTFNNAPSLQGNYSIISPATYDYNDHIQLAYARRMGRDSYVVYKLPMTVSTSGGNVELLFSLDYTNFTINLWNSSSSFQRPDAQQFERIQYRYIVIPVSTYQGLNINWNEYTEVAAALNL